MAQEPQEQNMSGERNNDDAPRSREGRSGEKSGGGRGGSRPPRPTVVSSRPPMQRRGRFQPRRKVCLYCADKEKVINWKNTDDLRRFINDSGGIFPRRKTGLCAKHQRAVAVAIKRARHLALFPYTAEHVRVMGHSSR